MNKANIAAPLSALAAVCVGAGLVAGARSFLHAVASPSAAAEQAASYEFNAAIGSSTDSEPDAPISPPRTAPVRYTAAQEEELIDAAMKSLPSTAVKKVKATAYYVKDLTTGEVVLQKDALRLLPIASLTKLVTAEVARQRMDPSDRITLTPSVIATYGNTADFHAGETFTAGDLLYPLLMVSSNDAAEAYAQKYGRAAFIRAMNDFAQSIGAYRTYFADPSGLSPENVSSAADVALILDWVRRNDPDVIAITDLKTKTLRSHVWFNPTHFLNWSYYIGGKNGYTDEADRTTASLFRLGAKGDIYAVVILGSENRDADIVSLISKIK